MKKPVKKTVKKQVFKHKSDNIFEGLGLDGIRLKAIYREHLEYEDYDKKSKAAEKILKLHNDGVVNIVECMWLYHQFIIDFYGG